MKEDEEVQLEVMESLSLADLTLQVPYPVDILILSCAHTLANARRSLRAQSRWRQCCVWAHTLGKL